MPDQSESNEKSHADTRLEFGQSSFSATLKDAIPVSLRVNGKNHDLRIDPRTTLLDCLREHLHLTGSKKGCDHGQCGACTVHINGRRVTFVSLLRRSARGRRDHDDRGHRSAGEYASDAGRVRDMRCVSMRLLHFRTDHVGGGALEGTVRTGRRGGEGVHERQHLPLRRVSEHRGRDSKCAAKTRSAEAGMKTFQLTRADG